MKELSWEELKNMLLYRKIVEWTEDKLVLDNSIEITIEMTDSDCCANAYGDFSDVKLDAVITDISKPKNKYFDDGYTYGNTAVVKFLHNRNLICKANGYADAGNGGYYFSIASFVLTLPEDRNECFFCEFVSSEN